jgi:hypothetical protein
VTNSTLSHLGGPRARQFLVFFGGSLVGLVIDLVGFQLLLSAAFAPWVANATSSTASITAVYLLVTVLIRGGYALCYICGILRLVRDVDSLLFRPDPICSELNRIESVFVEVTLCPSLVRLELHVQPNSLQIEKDRRGRAESLDTVVEPSQVYRSSDI